MIQKEGSTAFEETEPDFSARENASIVLNIEIHATLAVYIDR
jgi:hypothetical protein